MNNTQNESGQIPIMEPHYQYPHYKPVTSVSGTTVLIFFCIAFVVILLAGMFLSYRDINRLEKELVTTRIDNKMLTNRNTNLEQQYMALFKGFAMFLVQSNVESIVFNPDGGVMFIQNPTNHYLQSYQWAAANDGKLKITREIKK